MDSAFQVAEFDSEGVQIVRSANPKLSAYAYAAWYLRATQGRGTYRMQSQQGVFTVAPDSPEFPVQKFMQESE